MSGRSGLLRGNLQLLHPIGQCSIRIGTSFPIHEVSGLGELADLVCVQNERLAIEKNKVLVLFLSLLLWSSKDVVCPYFAASHTVARVDFRVIGLWRQGNNTLLQVTLLGPECRARLKD